jgi:hypothetical protein
LDYLVSVLESPLQQCRRCSGGCFKNINAYQYAKGAIREDYMRQRTVDSVLKELDKGLFFQNVPDNFKAHKVILLAALRLGIRLGRDHFSEALNDEKDSILGLIALHHGNLQSKVHFYSDILIQLQRDEDIAKDLLKAGCPTRVAILTNVPSLLHSQEAMMNAVALT